MLGGTVHRPLGGLGGVLAANQGQPGTTWDMLRRDRHTAPPGCSARWVGQTHRTEDTRGAGGGQATRSRDPGEARGGDLKPSVHGGGMARRSPGMGQALRGKRPRGGWRGRNPPGLGRAGLGRGDRAVPAAGRPGLGLVQRSRPRPAPPNTPPTPTRQSRQTRAHRQSRPPPQTQSRCSVCTGGRSWGRQAGPRRPPASASLRSQYRPLPTGLAPLGDAHHQLGHFLWLLQK